MANNYKDLEPKKISALRLFEILQEQLERGYPDVYIDGTVYAIEEDGVHAIITTNQPQM